MIETEYIKIYLVENISRKEKVCKKPFMQILCGKLGGRGIYRVFIKYLYKFSRVDLWLILRQKVHMNMGPPRLGSWDTGRPKKISFGILIIFLTKIRETGRINDDKLKYFLVFCLMLEGATYIVVSGFK